QVVALGTQTRDAAAVPFGPMADALAATRQERGYPLTEQQRQAVVMICTRRHQIDVVVGVAGSGKTTTLACVTDAYQRAGFTVIGTATSGQAARTFGREATPNDSRTLASLCWNLEHDRIELSRRHVVILDEAGMTNDPDLLRLLIACEEAGAKVVM